MVAHSRERSSAAHLTLFHPDRGLFDDLSHFTDVAAYYDRADKCAGVFYGGDGAAVAAAVVFILAIIAWVGAACGVLFMVIKFTVGMRVSKEMEVR